MLNKVKRPILVIAIGYIIGIIEGLYLKSIVPIYIFITILYLINKILEKNGKISKDINSKNIIYKPKRYLRYIKLYININTILIFIITSFITFLVVKKTEQKYIDIQKILEKEEQISILGRIEKIEDKEYEKIYTVQIQKIIKKKKQIKTKKIKIYVHDKKRNKEIEIGDIINVKGKFEIPEGKKNYGGFDYNQYLKTKNIIGSVEANTMQKINEFSKSNPNIITSLQIKAFRFSQNIQDKINKILPSEISSILIGLILGNTEYIEENITEDFRNANMSHVLAISGQHMSYLILITTALLKRILGKRNSYITCIFVLIIYTFITGFSPSIVRATIMGIIFIISKLIYKYNDILTNISISSLIILIYNPYNILDLGFQLSFGGTIGIVLFQKYISKIFNKIKEYFISKQKFKNIKAKKIKILEKFLEKVFEITSVTISAQIIILPISIFHFNTFNIYSILTNLLIGFVVETIMACSFIFLILICININLAQFFSIIIIIAIKILILISKIGKFPYSKIYVSTPKIWQIIFYFLIIFFLISIFNIYTTKSKNSTNIRVKNLISLLKFQIKYRVKPKSKKNIKIACILIIIILGAIKISPKQLQIHFVDVGQGDCTFIETPLKKTILIDGGGTETYDIGKNTLLPYILDRGYTKIDTVLISHFDTDHVKGILTILENLRIGQVIISKQEEISQNYKDFVKIVKDKNIKVKTVEKGDKIKIEKDIYIDILFPEKEIIQENILNNNAIVAKLSYKKFSIMFTGDIEEVAEKRLLEIYNKSNILQSNILKVAHHGSKTSSTKNILGKIRPQICLIGVGKDNKFGHPNNEVIKRLEELNADIYRTDRDGEISIITNGKSFNIKKLK